jgi:hypothetical protein
LWQVSRLLHTCQSGSPPGFAIFFVLCVLLRLFSLRSCFFPAVPQKQVEEKAN